MNNESTFQGKTVLITGGSSGIGKAAAIKFAEQGARVIITGRDAVKLNDTLQLLPGNNHTVLQSDAGTIAEIDKLVRDITISTQNIDVLFINAAYVRPEPLTQTSPDEFDAMLNVNFKGPFFLLQKVVPFIKPGGSVLITTSITNKFGAPNFSVYAACKAALASLVQTASLELTPLNIRVNAISPGPIDTPGFGNWDTVPEEAVQAIRAHITNSSPVKRFGTAEEVANVALFLSSDAASYITGSEMIVDGGMSVKVMS